ncbi:hypothetical protein [Weissella paramesenteroides]|uniref:Uncharacterized protein n=1 Tax=Weissella paramesenteroides ATCC 33313 TaxID=585506 RepID=C5R804_WEIPA|nr:hypothetical protein [Weissella paramesenteroides]EER75588.1 hypothetical protein HMPREF0877_0099 [Weissella paramesenteroides ATCC 33313]
MDEYYRGIEKVSNDDFIRLLHGNRSIQLKNDYEVGDEILVAGPYVVETKIKGKYNGKYKVSKAIRVDIYGGNHNGKNCGRNV